MHRSQRERKCWKRLQQDEEDGDTYEAPPCERPAFSVEHRPMEDNVYIERPPAPHVPSRQAPIPLPSKTAPVAKAMKPEPNRDLKETYFDPSLKKPPAPEGRRPPFPVKRPPPTPVIKPLLPVSKPSQRGPFTAPSPQLPCYLTPVMWWLQDGAFLVRHSSAQSVRQPYTLVVLYQEKVYNIPVRFLEETQSYALGKEGKKTEEIFGSLQEIISHHMKNPILLIDSKSQAKQTTYLTHPAHP
ncbi:B-cell linker protein-like [Scleropages formosus]|uniref:B-cell linker protein-like n=1 Tax=Scleropages formosus TaxID=113540 RepID=A0A0P7USU5_SCLFO|nr:B-cell linker protein-like [Scleropages formosus]